MANSTWKPVDEFDGAYEVSDVGQVRNATTGLVLAVQTDVYGRPWVALWQDNKMYGRRVSRLMGIAFLPEPQPGQTDVCHNDGDAANNVVANLRWDTHKENLRDRIRHGTNFNGNSRKTHCKHGHEFTPENTVPNGNGRKCRTCHRRIHRERRNRKRIANEVAA